MLDADALSVRGNATNKNLNNEVLICYGYGDGGGGPTRQMLECSSHLEQGIAGIQRLVQESPVEYFERLDERVRNHTTSSHSGKVSCILNITEEHPSMGRNKRK